MLGEAILSEIKSRGISLTQLCKMSGLRYSTLHSQIHNGREIPFTTVDKIAGALNLPIAHFSNRNSEPNESRDLSSALQAETARALSDIMSRQAAAMADMGYQIGTDDVLDWLTANGNRLVNHSWLIDRINLYYPTPEGSDAVRPVHLGRNNLTTRYFKLEKLEDYTTMFKNLDPARQQEIIASHQQATQVPYSVNDQMIDTLNEHGQRVTGTYRRLLAQVSDQKGQNFILSYSKLTHFSTG